MSGVFGLDLQPSRSVIALVEGTDVGSQPRPVGDGHRPLVPNACSPGSLWGSRAAEAQLAALDPDELGPADQLLVWRCDPLAETFLRGAFERLRSYLGQVEPTGQNGYQVCVSGHLVDDALISRCRAVGWNGAGVVQPTDALLTRWLSDPVAPSSFDGTVVAIACGEAETALTAYRVERSGTGLWVETVAGSERRTGVGTGAVSLELARIVLARCRESVPSRLLLPLLDGTWEFAAGMRARSGTDQLQWQGALAGHLFAPLSLRRDSIASWPATVAVTSAVTEALSTVPIAGAAPLILVGGIGAVWPFVAEAVRDAGPVWESRAQEHDLAFGAAKWPCVCSRFTSSTGRGMRALETVPPPVAEKPPLPGVVVHTSVNSTASPEDDDIPPWERDRWPLPNHPVG